MLVLTRRLSERVRLKLPDGTVLWVAVVSLEPGRRVRLGFDAPRSCEIDREEILDQRTGERR